MKTLFIAKLAIPLVALLAVACNKSASASDAEPAPVSAPAKAPQVVAISVGPDGFQPSSVHAAKDQKLTLTFTEQYRNMKEILDQHPAVLERLLQAMHLSVHLRSRGLGELAHVLEERRGGRGDLIEPGRDLGAQGVQSARRRGRMP